MTCKKLIFLIATIISGIIILSSLLWLFYFPKDHFNITVFIDNVSDELNDTNTWFQISRPFDDPIPENRDFLYPDLFSNLSKKECIDRSKYSKELVRYAGILPSDPRLKEPLILIIGASTALGEALARKLKRENIPFLSINGQSYIDFSSPEAPRIFDEVNITEAYVFWSPPLPRYSYSDFRSYYLFETWQSYVSGLSSFLRSRNIPYVYSIVPPHIPEFTKAILDNEGLVLELPYFIDSKAQYDLSNPLIRTYTECLSSGYSNLYVPDLSSPIFPVTSDDLIPFIQKALHNKQIGHYKLGLNPTYDSDSLLTIKEAVETMTSQLKCDLKIRHFNHTINEEPPTTFLNISTSQKINKKATFNLIKQAFRNYKLTFHKTKTYLSIVICGRHDNFSNSFETRAQNFLNQLSYCKLLIPTSDFEVVFVDYATPPKTSTLDTVLTIPDNLKGFVRFIIVDSSVHDEVIKRLRGRISFLEYIAKNIGIRRSKGQYVLTMNPDDLISPDFFELVAGHTFSEGILYRAFRYDMSYNCFRIAPASSYGRFLTEPSILLKDFNVQKRCNYYDNHFTLFDSVDSYRAKNFLCGIGDFILLSRKVWEAIGGFNEYPGNPNVDAVLASKMMRLVPGFFQYIIDPIILHQYHPKKNMYRACLPNHEVVMDEYSCSGRSDSLTHYQDPPDWGLNTRVFPEVVK